MEYKNEIDPDLDLCAKFKKWESEQPASYWAKLHNQGQIDLAYNTGREPTQRQLYTQAIS